MRAGSGQSTRLTRPSGIVILGEAARRFMLRPETTHWPPLYALHYLLDDYRLPPIVAGPAAVRTGRRRASDFLTERSSSAPNSFVRGDARHNAHLASGS